jgi:hypothetical protein
MARTAVGYFRDRVSADSAADELVQRGFGRGDVSVVERGREQAETGEASLTAGEGAAVGGVAGLLIGVGAMLVPGVGPLLAAGPLAAALAGAVTGGVTGAAVGGVAGALVDAGVDEHAARYYDEQVKTGGLLLTVRTDDAHYDVARDVLQRHGADLHATAGAAVAGGTTVRQSVGASPAAPGFPDPRPMVGDDPGLIDTPAMTPTGTTGDTEAPDPTLDPDRATRTPTNAPSSGRPSRPRSGGPPII